MLKKGNPSIKTSAELSRKPSGQGKKVMVVTKEEHEKWHKENGSCGSGKEHNECMKKRGITIEKRSLHK